MSAAGCKNSFQQILGRLALLSVPTCVQLGQLGFKLESLAAICSNRHSLCLLLDLLHAHSALWLKLIHSLLLVALFASAHTPLGRHL